MSATTTENRSVVRAFSRSWWPWLSVVARLVVGVVWIVAGAIKLTDPESSVRAVRAYQILPESIVPLVGRALPPFEVVLGVLLIVGLGLRIVAILSAVLQLAFIVGIASAWTRGIQIDCGCFGGGGFDADATSKYPWEIARDTGLLALSLLIAIWPRSRFALDNVLLPPIAPDDRA